MKNKLLYTPEALECDGVRLFEGEDSRSIADKDFDANYWVTLKYITECKKVFSLEVTTLKKEMGEEFFDDFLALLDKHSKD